MKLRIRTGLFVLLLGAAATNCGDDGGDDGEGSTPDADVDSFDLGALLSNVGENVLLPTFERFDRDVADLTGAADAYCTALGTADEEVERATTQAAWKTAMISWQLAQVMQIGLADDDDDGLQDLIYSWPVVSACAVDQSVMTHFNDPAAYDISVNLSYHRGLDAIEYLLFNESLESVCLPAVQPDGWDVLTDAERRAARCGYAQGAIADLAVQSASLVDAWRPAGGDFLGELTSAGNGSQRFASELEAVNTVFGALFFIDTVTKDQKLRQPAGMAINSCNVVDAPCLDELESQHAFHSKENIVANLEGFRMLFGGEGQDGQDGSGFDDFLVARDRADLAESIKQAIADAAAAVDTMPGSLRDALQNDYSSVTAAHDAVKGVTDPLKTEVPGILDLEIPKEAGGDND